MTVLYHVQQSPTTKVCSHCHSEKPLTAFQVDRKRKDGHKVYCRVCQSELDKAWRETRTFSTIPLTKVCSKCHSEKSIECFYPAVHCKDGYRPDCIECFNARGQAKRIAQKEAKFWANLTQLELLAPTKVCIKCHIEKSLDSFYIHRSGQYGVESRCKECIDKEVQHRAAKGVEQRLPISKTCSKCKVEKPLEDFPESTGYGKYGRNSICSDCVKMWRKENPHKARAISMSRIARIRGAAIGDVNFDRILERDGYWCYICGANIDIYATGDAALSFDHVLPLAGKGERKGTHTEDNIKPAHRICNTRKRTSLLNEMTPYQRRGVK